MSSAAAGVAVIKVRASKDESGWFFTGIPPPAGYTFGHDEGNGVVV
jgi:hypothetical protein